MGTSRELLATAADVVCGLSAGQAEALASEIRDSDGPRHVLYIGGFAAPDLVRELCDEWISEGATSPAALADAISCAALAVKTVSSYEKVELLYTGPDASLMRRNVNGLLEVVRGSRQEVWIVSYLAVGVDEVWAAAQERAENGVTVRILLDHLMDAFDDGLLQLMNAAPSCELYIWPDDQRAIAGKSMPALHAKCAVADGRQAFVSSANLTSKALDRNLEVGYLVTGGHTPRQLAEHLDQLRTSKRFQLLEAIEKASP